MTHIVFNEADVKVLESAIELDEQLNGRVICIHDDYAVGPIDNIYEPSGIEERKAWWQMVCEGGDYEQKSSDVLKDDNATLESLIKELQENDEAQIWIWAAQNKHDVSGYYWLLPFLKPFQGRVQILYLNNLPFINEKGNIFYPNWLSEIPAKEFLKAKKLARDITLSEFEVDPDEWTKLCVDNKGVRMLEGGKKLMQHEYDFYDSELKKFILPEWQKAGKIIHQFLSKAKHTTGDAFLLWRLKVMVAMGMFEAQGKNGQMKEFEIRQITKAE